MCRIKRFRTFLSCRQEVLYYFRGFINLQLTQIMHLKKLLQTFKGTYCRYFVSISTDTFKNFAHVWISKILSYILRLMLIGCSLTSSLTNVLSISSSSKSCFPMFLVILISMAKAVSLSTTTLSLHKPISKIVIC